MDKLYWGFECKEKHVDNLVHKQSFPKVTCMCCLVAGQTKSKPELSPEFYFITCTFNTEELYNAI